MKTPHRNKEISQLVFSHSVRAFQLQINLMKYRNEWLVDQCQLAFFLTENIVRALIIAMLLNSTGFKHR